MIQNVIRDMGGIAAFGVISICLFFAVFTVAAIYAFVQRKAFCDRMCALPLDDGSRECSADLQSAVSQVCNLPGDDSPTRVKTLTRTDLLSRSRLQVGDTADCKSALQAKGPSHE